MSTAHDDLRNTLIDITMSQSTHYKERLRREQLAHMKLREYTAEARKYLRLRRKAKRDLAQVRQELGYNPPPGPIAIANARAAHELVEADRECCDE